MDYIFWQNPDDNGNYYVRYYSPSTFPHIAILDPRTGEQLRFWEEFKEPEELVKELTQFLELFPFEGHIQVQINSGIQILQKVKDAKNTTETKRHRKREKKINQSTLVVPSRNGLKKIK